MLMKSKNNKHELPSPLRSFSRLQVKQQRRNDLVHVLRVPDVRLQFIVDGLPHHTLQSFDSGYADPDTFRKTEMIQNSAVFMN